MFLDLAGRRCVVVGGGTVATRKVETLLRHGALVVLVSPEIAPPLVRMREQGRITHVARPYRHGDLEGASLAFAATDQPAVNAAIRGEATVRGIWVNDVMVPEAGTFSVPATFSRGALTIAIATGGSSPALAGRIRRELEARFGEEYADMVEWLERLRGPVLAAVPDSGRRQHIFQRLVDSEVLHLLREGAHQAARGQIGTILAEEGITMDGTTLTRLLAESAPEG